MNILVIPTTDWLCHPTPHRHHYLAWEMARRHKVYVLHFNMYESKDKVKNYGEILLDSGGQAQNDLATYYIKNRKQHRQTIYNILKEKNIDVVLGANLLPSLLGFQMVRKRRKEGQKVIGLYDVSDYFPESAAIYYPEKAIKSKVIFWGSNYLYKKNLRAADALSAVSLPLRNQAAKLVPGKDVKLVTNGVETRRFCTEKDPSQLKRQLNLTGKVIGLVGSIEKWLDIEPTLRGFKLLAKDIPDLKYLIVGDSIKTKYAEELKSVVKELGIEDRVVFTGFVPYEEVPLYVSAMDVAICPFRAGLFMSDIALPNKIFEYMACGKPIACSDLKEVRREAGDFISFYDGEEDFARVVKGLLSNGENREKERLEWVSGHSWESRAIKLEAIFQEELGKLK